MGQDIAIRTRVKIKLNNSPEKEDFFPIFQRGFCSFCENARNNSTEIIDSLTKALNFNLNFLLEPQFFEDPDGELPNFEIWVDLKPFLTKLNVLMSRFGANPNYEQEVIYDRKSWWNYFGDDFQKDIKTLRDFLVKAETQGISEFTFEVF
ncbi:hypothetical protein BKI52_16590 [marine bacterium AO1-C]|nr:hypothetical protein BKI52_16590 [marine bacterium AO1-C]